jgi:hypothetical protein
MVKEIISVYYSDQRRKPAAGTVFVKTVFYIA